MAGSDKKDYGALFAAALATAPMAPAVAHAQNTSPPPAVSTSDACDVDRATVKVKGEHYVAIGEASRSGNYIHLTMHTESGASIEIQGITPRGVNGVVLPRSILITEPNGGYTNLFFRQIGSNFGELQTSGGGGVQPKNQLMDLSAFTNPDTQFSGAPALVHAMQVTHVRVQAAMQALNAAHDGTISCREHGVASDSTIVPTQTAAAAPQTSPAQSTSGFAVQTKELPPAQSPAGNYTSLKVTGTYPESDVAAPDALAGVPIGARVAPGGRLSFKADGAPASNVDAGTTGATSGVSGAASDKNRTLKKALFGEYIRRGPVTNESFSQVQAIPYGAVQSMQYTVAGQDIKATITYHFSGDKTFFDIRGTAVSGASVQRFEASGNADENPPIRRYSSNGPDSRIPSFDITDRSQVPETAVPLADLISTEGRTVRARSDRQYGTGLLGNAVKSAVRSFTPH